MFEACRCRIFQSPISIAQHEGTAAQRARQDEMKRDNSDIAHVLDEQVLQAQMEIGRFAAQIADVGIKTAIRGQQAPTQGAHHKLLARHRFGVGAHELLEDAKFRAGQLKVMVINQGATCAQVDFEAGPTAPRSSSRSNSARRRCGAEPP